MVFIDVPGASGTVYRFRLWARGEARPPMAANYVVVRDQGGPQVVAVGVTDDLASLDPEALRRRADGQVFTRLNFSRRIRMAEHADIVADHERAEVLD